jgi:quercetin dioxygenase-like cupin family protein
MPKTGLTAGDDSMTEREPLNEPVDLAGLADYSDGSIVSRTLQKKPSGTVTLFAFAAGQALSEHTTPFDALIQLLDGQAEVVIAGVPHTMAAGQILQLPANVPHCVAADGPFKMLLIMLR